MMLLIISCLIWVCTVCLLVIEYNSLDEKVFQILQMYIKFYLLYDLMLVLAATPFCQLLIQPLPVPCQIINNYYHVVSFSYIYYVDLCAFVVEYPSYTSTLHSSNILISIHLLQCTLFKMMPFVPKHCVFKLNLLL